MIGGALLVAALALVLDLVLALLQRSIVSPGLTGRTSRRRLRSARSAADADTGSATTHSTREQATA